MERSYFLDRDIVIDKQNNVYTVLTNYNPPGYIFAYLKYVYTGKGLWKGYERVLKEYGIHNLIKIKQRFIFESCYDAYFPVLFKSELHKHLKPEDELKNLIKRSINDDLSYTLLDFVERYVKLTNVGITGSLLLGSYHANSDIDIIIYGCKRSLDFIESFNGFERDQDWITSANNNYNIDFADLLYSNKRRGIYKGKRISVLFADDKPWRYCEKVCEKLGKIRFSAVVSGGCEALFYPSVATVESGLASKIVSYEGVFSNALYGNKRRVLVEGMLMKCEDEKIVIVGDRNVRGFIKPLQ